MPSPWRKWKNPQVRAREKNLAAQTILLCAIYNGVMRAHDWPTGEELFSRRRTENTNNKKETSWLKPKQKNP
jgi:hypothetical protein